MAQRVTLGIFQKNRMEFVKMRGPYVRMDFHLHNELRALFRAKVIQKWLSVNIDWDHRTRIHQHP